MKNWKFNTWLREQAGTVGNDPTTKARISREELGGLLIEYVNESEHSGWEGFSSRDVTGIRRMLDDMVAYYEAASKELPDHFKKHYYTGTIMFPGHDNRIQFWPRGDDMKVYVQFDDGRETELLITEPDPEDGTYCAHLVDSSSLVLVDDGSVWIRICPNA